MVDQPSSYLHLRYLVVTQLFCPLAKRRGVPICRCWHLPGRSFLVSLKDFFSRKITTFGGITYHRPWMHPQEIWNMIHSMWTKPYLNPFLGNNARQNFPTGSRVLPIEDLRHKDLWAQTPSLSREGFLCRFWRKVFLRVKRGGWIWGRSRRQRNN